MQSFNSTDDRPRIWNISNGPLAEGHGEIGEKVVREECALDW